MPSDDPTVSAPPSAPADVVPTDGELHSALPVGLAYQQPDGNRVTVGAGALPATEPIDIVLAGTPQWVAATPMDDGAVWAAVLNDGAVHAFRVANESVMEMAVTPPQLPAGMPPLLQIEQGTARLVVPDAPFSPAMHPVLLHDPPGLAFIDPDGNLVVQQGEQTTTLPVNALPDARILVDERQRLLLLSAPTTRYGHGVLGDDVEAAAITLVETAPTPEIVREIGIAEPHVIEGIAPIWTDWNGDGAREIIVTLSSADAGAQIVVYDEEGTRLASGPAIGRGFRWRHQLAVAPFGPAGEMELVDVLTPHIGGTVEFYRWNGDTLDGDTLDIVAQQSGFTSHVIGTRNLDMAAAADFDGDGHVELLLPNQVRTALGAIRHEAEGATVAWTLPVNGTVATNLATVQLSDGWIAVGVGQSNGSLRVWQ